MKYRIRRVGTKYYAQTLVGGLFQLGCWRDITGYGRLETNIDMMVLSEDSEEAARKRIERHKAIEAEENDIEIIEVKD